MHTLGSSMGMQHSDASVRQISIDLVGSIAAYLHRCNLAAEADQEWLAQMAVPDGKANCTQSWNHQWSTALQCWKLCLVQ